MSTDGPDDRVLLTRTVQLEPELVSASAARHLLRAALHDADCAQWIDTAELALGEVVANAVLHAHTRIQLSLEVRAGCVHVEVYDGSPIQPIPRDYDTEATTGRGMALVAALTSDCGVRSLGAAGKVVWFEVGDDAGPPQSEQDLLDAWDSWEEAEPADTAPAGQPEQPSTVTLVDLPPLLWLAARQHHDALIRELVLHAAEHAVPGVDVAAADRARGTISEALTVRLEELRRTATPAAEPGGSFSYQGAQPWMPACLDLPLTVSPSLARDVPVMQDTLDTGERLAAAGQLLTLPGLPEIVEVRDWVCDQVVAQLAGVPPSPWPGSAHARFETLTAHGVLDIEWDARVVTESTRGVAAGDDANRILAVSRPLAEALGWDVDDLVGRRVVALIPPALREAHVAAFTRHLASGEESVLGQHLQLPVLRKDGTEVMSDFFLERAEHVRGRTVFLAWIEPLV